jgi:hypothetical protein
LINCPDANREWWGWRAIFQRAINVMNERSLSGWNGEEASKHAAPFY